MPITYQTTTKNINWQDLESLFSAVGWPDMKASRIKKAFSNSSFVRFVFDQEKLVGVGRTVDDGEFYGWIVDLAVHPDYQGRGIGKTILSELEQAMKPFFTTMLTSVPNKEEFYQNQGWCKQSSAYIYPRSEQQKKYFAE
jgi:aralkylamine N-acetyltransferase